MRKYQYYSTGDDGDFDGYGNNWQAQTFTVVTVHMISKIKIKLFRVGDPGTVNISIKATTGGKPTGADFCKGTIEGTDITTDTNGEYYEITLGAGYLFEKGLMYAIVVRAPDGDASNKVSWRADVGDATYPGGTYCSSSDGGVDWGIISGSDCMFEEWGVGEPAPSVVCWGLLYKSQIDSEKIEAAILRLITVHNDDEEAHVGAGQCLQSHKASEIIDHAVASVVADKFADAQTTIQGSLDSLDGWSSSGIAPTQKWPGWQFNCGTVLDAETKVYVAGDFPYSKDDFAANFLFQFSAKIGGSNNEVFQAYVGGDFTDNGTTRAGFRTIDGNLWGFIFNGVTETKTNLGATPRGVRVVLRMFFDAESMLCKFYINGVYISLLGVPTWTWDNELPPRFYIKNEVSGQDAAVRIFNIMLSADQ